MEYENLSLNQAVGGGGSTATGAPVNALNNSKPDASEADASNMCGGQEVLEVKAKEKARRYWLPSEEERLYEIWGRENWRLTRNGKNTIYFAQWSEELRERFSVDVKPEEIQMKVNQTRAKFRSVKKQLQSDPSCFPTRWKKFDLVNRILKNMHRPKNADPLPPDVLLNNRDVSPAREDEQLQLQTQPQTPQQQAQPTQQQQQQQLQQPAQQSVLNLTTETVGNNYYSNNSSNSNNSGSHNTNTNTNTNNSNTNANANNNNSSNTNNNNSTMSFNTELFTDQYDDIKHEYDDEDYRSLPFQEPMQQYSPAEPAQLLELQTPQQLQQQQQQHQQQQQFQPGYEQEVVNYAGGNAHYSNSGNSSSSNNVAPTSSINHQGITAVAYINSTNNTISVATNNNNSSSSNGGPAMQPPTMASSSTSNNALVPTPRKRGRPHGSSNPPAADSLESLYLEEVRRKNHLMAEQTKIARQRLELEERKLELLQTFFPKCLEQQSLILARVMQLPFQQQQPPEQ